MHSCLYEGTVSHWRQQPLVHGFEYRLFMAYLDLSELPALLNPSQGVLSERQYGPASFQEEMHLKGVTGNISLEERVREAVNRYTGEHPQGPIRLLTQLRYWGHYFSPLNLFYCFNTDDTRIEQIVAEVNNTPWGEQHLYVLWEGNRQQGNGRAMTFSHAKQFHVSPFMDMHAYYHWQLSPPEENLFVQIESHAAGNRFFSATMSLQRKPLTKPHLNRMTRHYPLMTARIVAAIYWQALRLWWKGCPGYAHPGKASARPPHASSCKRVESNHL